jgi:hypothetical protein
LGIEHFVCIIMEQTKLTPSGKPFDIHERLLLFACDIARLTQFLHTRFRPRVCQRTGLLSSEFFPMVQESDELVKILGKIVHNALRNAASEGRSKR